MNKTRALYFLPLLLLGAACDRYSENDLELIASYRATSMCSCLFVMERDEASCRAYSNQNPPVAEYTIDAENKVVESQALLLWSARARFVSERFGCALER